MVPGNLPAISLYQKYGFTFAGTKDLGRDLEEIPMFELYERNLPDALPQAPSDSGRHPAQ